MPESQNQPGTTKTLSLRAGFDTLLVFMVFLIAGGDPAPHRNEPHYLCRLKHFWDPAWCQGDLFLESPDAHFTVVWLFGWVTQLLSLEATAWLGRGLSWALIAWAWQRLSWRVAPLPLLAPLGAALLVMATEQLHFAGEWIVGGFEAKTLAYGLVLFALGDALDSRWNRAWILLGGASALHALVGGWSVVALLFAWAVCRSGPSLKSMLPGLAIGAGLSLFGVVPALMLNYGTASEVIAQANQIYVFERLPHHLAPLSKSAEWLIDRGIRHARLLTLFGILHAVLIPKLKRSAELQLIACWSWGAVGLSAIGFAIEIVGLNDPEWTASLLRYYFFRLADIAVPIAASLVIVSLVYEALAKCRFGAMALTALLGTASLLYLADYAYEHVTIPVAPSDQKAVDPVAWVEMCHWIEANTPEDAIFLVPRTSQSFKWHAQRAEVVTYKDIPQDAASMIEWHRRFRDVYQVGVWESGKPRWTRSLAHLGAKRLVELGENYGARYALSQASRYDLGRPGRYRASLPVVHQVGPYTLYDLQVASDKDPSELSPPIKPTD